MTLSRKHIKPLIYSGKPFSKWLGYVGLATGMIILLLAVQMFHNVDRLMRDEAPQRAGEFDFVSISKVITNENMGRDNRFTPNDMELIANQPEVADVAPLYTNQFSARASAGDVLPFTTDLFLESLDTSFLDVMPSGFNWAPGDSFVPLIFSTDFLEMYNVFAPSQGLPQLSPRTVTSVNIFLECAGPRGAKNFRAGVVGLSDRVNSILSPESFIKWANLNLAGDSSTIISRVYIKTPDVNNPALISFFEENGFHINKDKIRFGRIKGLLKDVLSIIGSFGILVIILALVIFAFYLQLMIARSRENLSLLLKLGYSPTWLSATFTRILLPAYGYIIILALLVSSAAQWIFSRQAFAKETISPFLHFSTWITAAIWVILAVLLNSRMVKREIAKLNTFEQ